MITSSFFDLDVESAIEMMVVMVFQAEERIMAAGMDKEYAGIAGIPEFCKAAAGLAFGENSPVLNEGKVSADMYICSPGLFRTHQEKKKKQKKKKQTKI